ncbi:hypothetical protein [Streptomyces sp. NPDC093591]|uniref:hypothetical protein n=1 Tax=Streptomyces sp. NPDC093591 TaxID=3366044 RepID=UPI0037FA9F40
MIAEAADTFVLIIDTAVMWVQILAAAAAFVLCVVCFAIGPLVTPAAKAAARRAVGPSWARGRLGARMYVLTRLRRSSGRTRPPWVHTQPLDYEEAA